MLEGGAAQLGLSSVHMSLVAMQDWAPFSDSGRLLGGFGDFVSFVGVDSLLLGCSFSSLIRTPGVITFELLGLFEVERLFFVFLFGPELGFSFALRSSGSDFDFGMPKLMQLARMSSSSSSDVVVAP